MLGTVVSVDYDGTFVRSVQLDLPAVSKTSPVVVSTLDRIGQGSFGTVYRARCDFISSDIALKIASGKSSRLREELVVMSKVCTRGKISLSRQIFGALNADNTIVVLGLELYLPQTLHDYLLSEQLNVKGEMLSLAYQTVCAVAAVHECGCCHRDVKHQNFVFDTEANLKLIDFGLAAESLNPPPGDVVAGTVSFMAPEMARNALSKQNRVSVGAPADIWALGIVLFSIFTQKNPFPMQPSTASKEEQNEALLKRVAAGKYAWPTDKTIPAPLTLLVESLLQVDPNNRPSAAAILQNKLWLDRHRTPSIRLLKFLGIQDADFLLRASPIHQHALMKAVAARSEQVNSSVQLSAPPAMSSSVLSNASTTNNTSIDSSQLAIQRITVDVGPKRKAVREISAAIADEAEKSQRRSRSRKSVIPTGHLTGPAATEATRKKHLAEVESAPPTPPLVSSRTQRNPPPMPPTMRHVEEAFVPKKQPPFVSAQDAIATEKRIRAALQAVFMCCLGEMRGRVAIRMEEDAAQVSMLWLEPQQRQQAAHPHKFKEHDRVSKGYEYGFVCDRCDWEYLPNEKSLQYAHCTCGMDICPACYTAYRKLCTCKKCAKEFPSRLALRTHPCGKRSRSSEGAPPKPPGRRMEPTELKKTAALRAAAPPSPQKQQQQLNRRPVDAKALKTENWQPIARTVKASDNVTQPTEEEQRFLLSGEWVRYFHNFPFPSAAGGPLAFTYRIQPDRTGAIFLTNECPTFGAVMSSMERKVLMIEELDISNGRDCTSELTLTNAKCKYPREFEILQQTATIDGNLLKMQRSPGTVSVYQAPTSAVRSNGEPFIYVRWYRRSDDGNLTALLLSNGAMQVFVGREYELRWKNDARKFLVRCSGRCELIDPKTFKLMPQIEQLMFQS